MLRMDVFISLSYSGCRHHSTECESGMAVLFNHWHDSLISRATILIAHIHHVGCKVHTGNIAHTQLVAAQKNIYQHNDKIT